MVWATTVACIRNTSTVWEERNFGRCHASTALSHLWIWKGFLRCSSCS
jgi:hypothetical protein